MLILEVFRAVALIEEEILESSGVEYFNISVVSNGFVTRVQFVGIDLWDSEEDCRLYLDPDDEDRREPIKDCLRRRLREELIKLSTIKV